MFHSLVAVIATVAVLAAPAVSLRVSTPVGRQPLTQRLAIVIEPDAANRGYCLVYDSDTGQAGVKCEDLAGAEATRTRWVLLPRLTAGSYTAVVRVGRSDGSVKSSAEGRGEVVE